MNRFSLVVFGTLFIAASPAAAGCFDPPAPGVDWRRCTMHQRSVPDANLENAQLKDGRFTRTNFSGSRMVGVDGRRAKFIEADMRNVNLAGARLSGADLTKADLTGAVLRGADLHRAQLQRAILRNADLTGAEMGETDLLHADLSGATWLDGQHVCAEGSVSQCN